MTTLFVRRLKRRRPSLEMNLKVKSMMFRACNSSKGVGDGGGRGHVMCRSPQFRKKIFFFGQTSLKKFGHFGQISRKIRPFSG